MILNVIMLPSILFTAAVFDMPKWANKQLHNLQKQFLWRQTTSTEASRHKISPALLFTPKQAGGAGLASIELACQTQRTKHTLQWLIQRKDRYFYAWKAWMFRGLPESWNGSITPRKKLSGRSRRSLDTPGVALAHTMGEWVWQTARLPNDDLRQAQPPDDDLAKRSISWFSDGEWIVELPQLLPLPHREQSTSEEQFWPTYSWANNPWVVDSTGATLNSRKYNRIQECSISDLAIHRTGKWTYSMIIPVAGEQSHHQLKLRRWAIAILRSSPRLDIGQSIQVNPALRLRNQPELINSYNWSCVSQARAIGVSTDNAAGRACTIQLEQQSNGIHWRVVEGPATAEEAHPDIQVLQHSQDDGGIVFEAHPSIHGLQWEVQATIANKRVLSAINKQPCKRYQVAEKGLKTQVDGLEIRRRTDEWQCGVLSQLPKQLWSHGNELTVYQVWVAYRVAVAQLNLFHEGRQTDNSCRKLPECQGVKETLAHIFWECSCAQECWSKLISHWTGDHRESSRREQYRSNCAVRKAPALNTPRVRSIIAAHPDDEKLYRAEWTRIWRILSSVCITTLWIQRNRVVFQHEETSIDGIVQEFWTTGLRQLTALAKRERRSPERMEQGTRLQGCINTLEDEPREQSHELTSLAQPPDLAQTPALLTRLRIYQTSRN